jgi:hypothetical protein
MKWRHASLSGSFFAMDANVHGASRRHRSISGGRTSRSAEAGAGGGAGGGGAGGGGGEGGGGDAGGGDGAVIARLPASRGRDLTGVGGRAEPRTVQTEVGFFQAFCLPRQSS